MRLNMTLDHEFVLVDDVNVHYIGLGYQSENPDGSNF